MTNLNHRILHGPGLVAAYLLSAAFPSAGGDEDISSAQVPANGLLMVDNPGSMPAITENPSFGRSSDAGWVATPDTSDHAIDAYSSLQFCGQTRRLYSDRLDESYGNRTRYFSKYNDWLYSIDDTDAVALIGPIGHVAERCGPHDSSGRREVPSWRPNLADR